MQGADYLTGAGERVTFQGDRFPRLMSFCFKYEDRSEEFTGIAQAEFCTPLIHLIFLSSFNESVTTSSRKSDRCAR